MQDKGGQGWEGKGGGGGLWPELIDNTTKYPDIMIFSRKKRGFGFSSPLTKPAKSRWRVYGMFCYGAFTLIVCFLQFELVAELCVGSIWFHAGKIKANYIFFNDSANHVTVFTTDMSCTSMWRRHCTHKEEWIHFLGEKCQITRITDKSWQRLSKFLVVF